MKRNKSAPPPNDGENDSAEPAPNSIPNASVVGDKISAVPKALSNSAGFLLNRAARLIRERNTAALKPTGLSLRELGILRLVSGEGPLSQQALSERHKTDRTTIVEIIDQLESKGLVVRLQNEKDRRSYLITVTPRGEKELARANRLTNKEQEKYLAALSEEEWQTMRGILIRLISFHEGNGDK